MLSVFPSLLSWGQIAPLIIRVTIAAVILFWAYKTLRNWSALSSQKTTSSFTILSAAVLETISGILLVIGLWTQIAALYVTIDLIVRIIGKVKNKAFLTDGINYYVLVLVMTLSLLVLGSGMWSFDLPL